MQSGFTIFEQPLLLVRMVLYTKQTSAASTIGIFPKIDAINFGRTHQTSTPVDEYG